MGWASVEAAAKKCQLSERTIYRRLEDEEFYLRLQAIRSDMVQLKKLSLHWSDITDEGLKGLAPLVGLRELDLSENKLTDPGLAHLRP